MWKFPDLLLLSLKLTKFLISFLEPRVSFYSNFASLISVMRQVSGQFPPEKNWPLVRVPVSVKSRVSFRVGGQPDNFPRERLPPRQGQGLVQGQFWGWGQFPSGEIVLEHTPLIFLSKTLYLWTKGAHQSASFQIFNFSHEH